MGIEIVNPPLAGAPGQTVTSTFADPVQAYVWGMWGFSLGYGDAAYDVVNYSLGLKSQQSNANQISVTVQMDLDDGHDHRLSTNLDDSNIYPICIAITSSSQNSYTSMSNIYGIQNGSSQTVSLPYVQGGYPLAQSFVSGVNMSFGIKDPQLISTTAMSGLTYNGETGYVSSTATMEGSSGKNQTASSIDAGFVVSSIQTPIMAIETVKAQTNQPFQVTMSQLTSVSEVVVVVQGWQLQFKGGSRKLKQMKVGGGQPTTQKGSNVVTVPFLGAWLIDEHHENAQDDANSYCTALVIALP